MAEFTIVAGGLGLLILALTGFVKAVTNPIRWAKFQ